MEGAAIRMEKLSDRPIVGALAAAVIVVVMILIGTYAKEVYSFISTCSNPKPGYGVVKQPTTMECACLYSFAVTRHSAEERSFIKAFMANDQVALRKLSGQHGDYWMPMTFVKVQRTIHECIPQ